jgi:imidazolonepropionase-like amidohydrolase
VGVQQYTLEEMSAIVDAAALGDARVAAHAHPLEGINTAVRAGLSSIEHGSMLDEETVVTAADEGLLAPWSARKTREIAPHFQRSIRLAITEEVNIAFGTGAGVFENDTNGDDFRLLVEASMSPLQAILVPTREAATLLGAERELGNVEPGKRADPMAVTGDPLQEIELLRAVDFVMRAGIGYKSDRVPRI